MKIDFNKNLTDLSGNDIIENNKLIPLSIVLANNLVQEKSIKGITTLKAFEIALDLNKAGIVDLSVGERESVKEFVEDSNLTILVKVQLLSVFKESEDKK
ncbi:MAG: hypothetical protein HN704_17675 [Bacteroidetes bacterium]|jgi:hypothetical protein|nr:hypothetical protein [Bacteroidota bacterium]